MRPAPMRVSVFIAIAAAAWWAGEDLTTLFGNLAISALAAAVGAVLLARSASKSWFHRLAWALGGISTVVAMHLTAGALAHDAFNDCVRRGEDVRTALARFRRDHGRYPARLAELQGISVPGRLWLHNDLLHYSASASGYELWFRDWLVSFDATESHGFGGQK